MPYEKLLGQGRIKPYRARPREVEQLLQVAVRDLATEVEQALTFAHAFVEETRGRIAG